MLMGLENVHSNDNQKYLGYDDDDMMIKRASSYFGWPKGQGEFFVFKMRAGCSPCYTLLALLSRRNKVRI